MTRTITKLEAAELLLARAESHERLAQFAKFIPIPNVPIDDTGDTFSLIETPLASHHMLILECLQAMTDGYLRYYLNNGVPIGIQSDRSAITPHAQLMAGTGINIETAPHLSKLLHSLYPPYSCSDSKTEQVDQSTEKNIKKLVESAEIQGDIPAENPKIVANRAAFELGIENKNIEKCSRVMLMLPPGSAKSTYASVVFPSWEMGRKPSSEIILTGYGDTICKKHGKRSRQLCSSPAYENIFNSTLSKDTRAADEWELTNGSSYKASGILSGITGFRCDGLIWDDLTKGRKEADSVTIRNDTYNAYLDDARSRKKPTAWEVGIGTRWHEDEIMGRILPAGYAGESGFMLGRDGNIWFVVCIPAQAERDDDPLGRKRGEYIWKEWFHLDYWVDKKINARTWGSLYQQRPAPEEGIYFKSDWKRTYSTLPDKLDYYIGYDPAVSEEEDADDTCIQIWGVDQHAKLYLVDEWSGKVTMDIWIDKLLDYVKKFKPLEVISESGVIRRASEPFIGRAMRTRKTFAVFEWVSRNADKAAMSRGFQAMMASGQIYLPETSLGDDMFDECLRFPAGKDDHRVDAATNLCLRLEKIWEASPPDILQELDPILCGGGIKISSLMPPRFKKKESRWKTNWLK